MSSKRNQAAQRRLLPALHKYFRVELEGEVERIPSWQREPCIFVMNHTALIGLEVYLLHAALEQLRPGAPRPRTTVWPPFLKVPVLGNWYRAGGCLAMAVDPVVEVLRTGDSVLILPEGPDATDVRDEIGPFHAGVLRVVRELSGELDVPVVPLGWSGIDEANQWFVTTNSLLVKLLMKPAMPTFDFALLPRLPLLRPSKVVFCAGEPMRFAASDLDTEPKLRTQLARVRDTVVGLVGRAKDLRAKRIDESPAERLLHSAFRMHNVLWKRR
jgi:1-acyl-sn-glycerol-3-phosphate acyltransferase